MFDGAVSYNWIMDFTSQSSHARYLIPIGCDLGIRTPTGIRIKEDKLPGIDIDLSLEYDLQRARVVPTGVNVWSHYHKHPIEITGTIMRQLRIKDYVRSEINCSLWRYEGNEKWTEIKSFDSFVRNARLPQRIKKGQISIDDDFLLTWVGRIYRFNEVINEPPTKAVEKALGVSHPTASRWVAKAKVEIFDWDGSEFRNRLARIKVS